MEDNKLIIYKDSNGDIIVDAIYKDETFCAVYNKIINNYTVAMLYR